MFIDVHTMLNCFYTMLSCFAYSSRTDCGAYITEVQNGMTYYQIY